MRRWTQDSSLTDAYGIKFDYIVIKRHAGNYGTDIIRTNSEEEAIAKAIEVSTGNTSLVFVEKRGMEEPYRLYRKGKVVTK